VLLSRRGSLADQVIRLERTEKIPRPPAPFQAADERRRRAAIELEFFNGSAAADGGREYVTTLGPGQSTPAPWLNVIANPRSAWCRNRDPATPGQATVAEPAHPVVQRSGQ
jgi:cyclic beta-1,2-glucan synthetase